jgi:hypothetical protein
VAKVRDLGIKVIPATMQPPEAGGGGGCGISLQRQCANLTNCYAYTFCGFCSGHVSCIGCSPNICTYLGTLCGSCTILLSDVKAVCDLSVNPTIVQPPPELLPQQIAALKEQLQKQIAMLDELAKSAGPKTAAEIDAREKQLNEELAQLAARRKELK